MINGVIHDEDHGYHDASIEFIMDVVYNHTSMVDSLSNCPDYYRESDEHSMDWVEWKQPTNSEMFHQVYDWSLLY